MSNEKDDANLDVKLQKCSLILAQGLTGNVFGDIAALTRGAPISNMEQQQSGKPEQQPDEWVSKMSGDMILERLYYMRWEVTMTYLSPEQRIRVFTNWTKHDA